MKINLIRQKTKDRRQETEYLLNWRKQINLFTDRGRQIVIPGLKTQKILLGLLLCLFLCLNTSFISSAMAAPSQIIQYADAGSQGDRLPPKVSKAVVAELSELEQISPAKLKVTEYSRESWSDGCLGLPQPEEICAQAIVEGWRVVVTDGSQKWVYRTDNRGRNVRLESPKSAVL